MNAEYPCTNCIVQPCCTTQCDKLLDLISRVIKSYTKYENRSLLVKNARKYPNKDLTSTLSSLSFHDNVVVMNLRSKSYVIFNRKGKIVERKQ